MKGEIKLRMTEEQVAAMQQFEPLAERLLELQDRLGDETVETSVCAGMLTVTANCKQEILNVKIDPGMVIPENAELLESLLAVGVTLALQKAKLLFQENVTEKIKVFLPEMKQAIKTLVEVDED